VLTDHELKTLRELERQFTVGPVPLGAERRSRKRSRLADLLTLVNSMISTAAMLAAGSVGVALQPGTAAGRELEALTRLRQLFVAARSL
jgi:hypothetical protein